MDAPGAGHAVGCTGQRAGGVWQSLAGRVAIGLPAVPSLADVQTALILSVALGQRGAQPAIVPAGDPSAVIVVGVASERLALQPALRPGALPVLHVLSPDAARALVVASPLLEPLVSADASGTLRPPVSSQPSAMSLAAMGVHPASLSIYSVSSVLFELPFDQLPAGRYATALQLFGRGATLPADETLIASVMLGQGDASQLVWSRTFRGDVVLDGDTVPIPRGLLHHHLPVTLQLVRAGGKHACGASDTVAFQLRDSSGVALAKGDTPVGFFGDFVIPHDRTALVRIDPSASPIGPMIGLMARILVDAGARAAAIEVAPPAAVLDRPFISVSASAPADFAGSAPVRPDREHLVLSRPAAGVKVDLAGAGAMTVAQVVKTAGGVAGIWISPGAAAPGDAPIALGAGNVAVFAAAAAPPAVFDTSDPDLVIESPVGNALDSLLLRWRTELFLAAWLAVTLIAVSIVIRLRRPRRP